MPVTFLDPFRPTDIGLPPKFTDFRAVQREMAEFALYGPGGHACTAPTLGPKRWAAIGAPGGSGKTLGCNAIGVSSGRKYVILTATRTLEDQIVDDGFPIVNVRGRANYDCVERDRDGQPQTCEQGGDNGCRSAGTDRCEYACRVKKATKDSNGIVTNYQYWMHARARNSGALETVEDPIGLLICDEFHLGMENLARYLGTWISDQDLRHFTGPAYTEVLKTTAGAEWGRMTPAWDALLEDMLLKVQVRLALIVEQYDGIAAQAARHSKEYQRLSKLERSLLRICDLAGDGNWLWQLTRSGVSFQCIWPSRYAERYLWSGVDRVVLMSATLRPKALQLMGLRPAEYWFKEWPRQFPAANGPVYWVPTGKMGRKAGDAGLETSVAKMDEIFDEWGHLKGIIHTPSYKLAEYYASHSRHARKMILARQGEANAAAEKFRGRDDGCALIGPGYMAGWDFPSEPAGSWQLIPKLPYADRSDPVVQLRAEADEQIYQYDCMQALQQACLRRTRRPEDRCCTMITDDGIRNFRSYARSHGTGWFKVMDAPGGRVPKAWDRQDRQDGQVWQERQAPPRRTLAKVSMPIEIGDDKIPF